MRANARIRVERACHVIDGPAAPHPPGEQNLCRVVVVAAMNMEERGNVERKGGAKEWKGDLFGPPLVSGVLPRFLPLEGG